MVHRLATPCRLKYSILPLSINWIFMYDFMWLTWHLTKETKMHVWDIKYYFHLSHVYHKFYNWSRSCKGFWEWIPFGHLVGKNTREISLNYIWSNHKVEQKENSLIGRKAGKLNHLLLQMKKVVGMETGELIPKKQTSELPNLKLKCGKDKNNTP